MKVSVQLRKYGKDDAPAKLYFRVREGEIDIKASSPLTILPAYWDCANYCYKRNVPAEQVPKTMQDIFNRKVKTIIDAIYAKYHEGVDFIWLASVIKEAEEAADVKPEATTNPQSGNNQPQGRTDKTLLEFFEIYLETSNFNDWHYQSQLTVMKRVARYEKWLAYKMEKPDFKLYLTYFNKAGTQDYLDFIENEWKARDENPDFYKDVKLYADYNIRPMSKNTISAHAKRLFMFLNWCVRNGYLGDQTYNNVTIDQQVYGTPYYLTIEERDKVYYTDFSYDARLDYHKDKFIFQCLVGCRHNDLAALTWNHIVEGNFIEYIPHKNLLHGKTDVVRCPLCDKAKEILERLDPTMPYLFIKYCEENYRRDIKRILKLAGIDRLVTIQDPVTRQAVQKPIYEVAASHLARRTFIGNLYKQTHDPALISTLTGHAEHSKSFERYRAIDDDVKRDILQYIQ